MSTTTTKVKAIRKGTVQPVYDIGVAKNHNFFANGHLVSNCFQEQFMILAQKLAGFNPGDSDKMRKTLVKKDLTSLGKKSEEKELLEKKFVDGCVEVSGMKRELAKELFDKIAYFSLYGFNKTCHFEEEVCIYDDKGKFLAVQKLEEVKIGSFIKSRDETAQKDVFVKIIDKHDHGVLELFEIELETGEKIRCTMDHKFRTTCGQMLPVWMIMEKNLNIVVDAEKRSY